MLIKYDIVYLEQMEMKYSHYYKRMNEVEIMYSFKRQGEYNPSEFARGTS